MTNCSNCGEVDGFVETKGSQLGLYCDECGKWIKWVSKYEARLYRNVTSESNDESYCRGYEQGRIDLEANVLAELKRCADDYLFDFDENNFKLVARVFEMKR